MIAEYVEKGQAMGNDQVFAETVLTPLFTRLRFRFKHNSVFDEYYPFRRFQEVKAHHAEVHPDKLIYAVAEGADVVTSRYRIGRQSRTTVALERMVEAAQRAGPAMLASWEVIDDRYQTVHRDAAIKSVIEIASYAVQGQLTILNVLKGIVFDTLVEFIHPQETRQVALESTAWAKSVDNFCVVVGKELWNGVIPAFQSDSR